MTNLFAILAMFCKIIYVFSSYLFVWGVFCILSYFIVGLYFYIHKEKQLDNDIMEIFEDIKEDGIETSIIWGIVTFLFYVFYNILL